MSNNNPVDIRWFRGLRIDNNTWAYGFYARFYVSTDTFGHYILDALGNKFLVHAETVGQFIGRYDRTKVKIFEGDIMGGRFGTGLGGTSTRYREFNFTIKFYHSQFGIDIPRTLGKYRFFPDLEECVVVNNIHQREKIVIREQ